jgi:hypothetical protein
MFTDWYFPKVRCAPTNERRVTSIRSMQNPGEEGGSDESAVLPDFLNTDIYRGFIRTGLPSSGSRRCSERCGNNFNN